MAYSVQPPCSTSTVGMSHGPLMRRLNATDNAVGNIVVQVSLGTRVSVSLAPTMENKLRVLEVLHVPRKILFVLMEVSAGLYSRVEFSK